MYQTMLTVVILTPKSEILNCSTHLAQYYEFFDSRLYWWISGLENFVFISSFFVLWYDSTVSPFKKLVHFFFICCFCDQMIILDKLKEDIYYFHFILCCIGCTECWEFGVISVFIVISKRRIFLSSYYAFLIGRLVD